MADDKIIQLLEEIRNNQAQSIELQRQAIELSRNSFTKYERNTNFYFKRYMPMAIGIALVLGIVAFLLLIQPALKALLFLLPALK